MVSVCFLAPARGFVCIFCRWQKIKVASAETPMRNNSCCNSRSVYVPQASLANRLVAATPFCSLASATGGGRKRPHRTVAFRSSNPLFSVLINGQIPKCICPFMAPARGFEPPTPRLGGVCSIQLSYAGIFRAAGVAARLFYCSSGVSTVSKKLSAFSGISSPFIQASNCLRLIYSFSKRKLAIFVSFS